MTEISFTGSIGYITYLVEKYEKEGYEIKSYLQKNNVKFGPLVEVTMTKKEIEWPKLNVGDTITFTSDRVEFTGYSLWAKMPTLQEQLTSAVEREDYETAAILRDKIKAL
jgi:excinuclease UvrABC helicase subunit UvrB